MDRSVDNKEVRPWTVQGVVGALNRIHPIDAGEVCRELRGEAALLGAALREALQQAGDWRSKVTASALLLMLNDAAGREPFLAALSGPDGEERTLAVEFYEYHLFPSDLDLGWRIFRSQCPLTSDELFEALRHTLHPPWTGSSAKILGILCWQDFPQVRSLTRSLLSHPDEMLRRDLAESCLRAGRDEGAFAVIETMLRAAPAYVSRSEQIGSDFHIVKGMWHSIEAAAIRGAPDLRQKAAHLTMEFVSEALAAPDAASRFNVNEGLIPLHYAIKAIAAVMPEGARGVLERIIASDALSEYDRGLALLAYGKALGDEARPTIMAALQNPELRADAAGTLGPIAKDNNDARDISALGDALADEERPEVVAAIAKALLGAGPDGRTAVEAALERSEPWTKMELAWRIGGGTDRQFADALTEAGVMDSITDEKLAEALESGFDIRSLIWAGGERLVQFGVKSSTGKEHFTLFRDLVNAARPAISVDDLKEIEGRCCTVSYSFQGRVFSFEAHPQGRWHDVPAIMRGFDDFMQAIGRDDRCYELEGGGEWALFVVAPASKFEPLAARLGIPLERDSESARDAAKAYQRYIQNLHH